MIQDTWPRIAGLAVEDNGDVGIAWLAYDRSTDQLHIYDAAIFRREPPAIIAESLNARGRFIPVAHVKAIKAFAAELLNRGVNMMYDAADDSEGMAEIVTRTLWERARTKRLQVERRLAEWADEFKALQRAEGKVPLKGYPLMSATRHAFSMLEQGRPAQRGAAHRSGLYPKVSIV